MIDALGQDALDVLLADADRKLKAYRFKKEREQVIREDIADCEKAISDCEEDMWNAWKSVARWKEHKERAEQRLAELLKEKP